MIPQKTSPEHAAIIGNLVQALSAIPMGETVSYYELKKSGFRNNGDRWLLNKAREQAEKELGCCFECVRSVGIKRLASSEIPDVGLAALRGIRKKANKGKKRLDRVNGNSLAPNEQRRLIGMSAMLGAVSMISDGRRAKAIGAVADPVKPIPPQNILDMFRN